MYHHVIITIFSFACCYHFIMHARHQHLSSHQPALLCPFRLAVLAGIRSSLLFKRFKIRFHLCPDLCLKSAVWYPLTSHEQGTERYAFYTRPTRQWHVTRS